MEWYQVFWLLVGCAAVVGAALFGLVAYRLAQPLRVRRNLKLIEKYGSTLPEARRGKKRR